MSFTESEREPFRAEFEEWMSYSYPRKVREQYEWDRMFKNYFNLSCKDRVPKRHTAQLAPLSIIYEEEIIIVKENVRQIDFVYQQRIEDELIKQAERIDDEEECVQDTQDLYKPDTLMEQGLWNMNLCYFSSRVLKDKIQESVTLDKTFQVYAKRLELSDISGINAGKRFIFFEHWNRWFTTYKVLSVHVQDMGERVSGEMVYGKNCISFYDKDISYINQLINEKSKYFTRGTKKKNHPLEFYIMFDKHHILTVSYLFNSTVGRQKRKKWERRRFFLYRRKPLYIEDTEG